MIKAAHRHKINDLKDQRHGTYHAKILGAVFGVATAFGNHVGENREGNAANDAKDGNRGEEQKSYVVAKHAHHSNDFELIVGKTKFWFFCLIHNSTSLLDFLIFLSS